MAALVPPSVKEARPSELRYWIQFKKLRIFLAWFGGAFLFLNARISDASFRWGAPFVTAGEFLRLWALGYLERKGKKLATAGPFAHLRNPLYAGNFLIGLGVVLISGRTLNGFLFLLGFWILYRGTIRNEEERLRERFGGSYLDYAREVPRFLPRLTPYPFREKTSFQWKFLLKHREHVALAGLILCVAIMYLREEMLAQNTFSWKEEVAIAVGVGAVVALLGERVWDWRKKKSRITN